jgi:hypothetical protein
MTRGDGVRVFSLMCACATMLAFGGAVDAQPSPSPTAVAATALPTPVSDPATCFTHPAPPSVLVAAPAVSSGASVSIPMPAVELTTESSDSQVTARFGFSSGASTFGIEATGPVASKGDDTELLSLDGFSGSASVKATFAHVVWRGGFDVDAEKTVAACVKAVQQCDCVRSKLTPEQQDVFDGVLGISGRHNIGVGPAPLVLGLSAQGGRGDFQWQAVESATPVDEHHNNWSLGGSVGFVTRFGYVGANWKYERVFEGADEENVCRTQSTPGASVCTQTAVAAPTKKESSIGSLELRRFLGPVFGQQLAISPALHRDFRNKVWSVEVPIYAFADKSGLTGGTRLGWRSDKKAFQVGVFVGVAFQGIPTP